MLLCKKIKLEVSKQDAATLEFMQGKCRGLYNWHVMRLRDGEKWHFTQAKRSLQESKHYDPELEYVYGKLLAEVYYRLDKAMKAFFRRVAEGIAFLRCAIQPATSRSRGRRSSCPQAAVVSMVPSISPRFMHV